MPRCTKTRVPFEHTSPAEKKLASSADDTADSRSASSNTISGDLPPSSSVTCLSVDAASAITILPVAASPVSETLAIPRWRVSAWPTRASP